MPDLRHRTEHEARLAYRTSKALGKLRNRLVAFGVEKIDERPAFAWEQDRAELAALYLILLQQPYFESHDLLARQLDVRPNPAQRQTRYDAWAFPTSQRLATDLIDTTRERASELSAKVRGGTATVEERRLLPVSSPERAVRIGVTETTRAANAGEYAAVQEFSLETNRLIVGYWQTALDDRVCKICGPLHDLPANSWDNKFPSGPPAHVMCRCFLDWRVS